jgi:hypothetical protein
MQKKERMSNGLFQPEKEEVQNKKKSNWTRNEVANGRSRSPGGLA